MSYKKGDIVVVRFPFILKSGDEIQKGRPALVISNNQVERRYNDVILVVITSQIPEKIMELESIIEPNKENGLLKRSLLRLDFIMTILILPRISGHIEKPQVNRGNTGGCVHETEPKEIRYSI